jgi:hypothetical protein
MSCSPVKLTVKSMVPAPFTVYRQVKDLDWPNANNVGAISVSHEAGGTDTGTADAVPPVTSAMEGAAGQAPSGGGIAATLRAASDPTGAQLLTVATTCTVCPAPAARGVRTMLEQSDDNPRMVRST